MISIFPSTTRITSIALFLLLCHQALAQRTTISGQVKDSTDNILPYTTVTLFRSNLPSTPLKVTYTDKTGWYQFKNIDTGNYELVFSFAGFASQKINTQVPPSSTGLIIPTLIMYKSNKNLEQVTVVATRKLVEIKDDGITYNAEADPTANAEKLIDLLRKTPMVSVDADDNVTVNGQSSFRVLLNGRETAIFARNVKDALKSFPGSLVKRIEVITNPSAKYDAEGVAGIINIITKSKIKGYNGSASIEGNTVHGYYSTAFFNTKINKLGISLMGSFGGNDGYRFEEKELLRAINNGPYYARNSNGYDRNYSNSPDINAELAYDVDSITTIAFYGSLSFSHRMDRIYRTFRLQSSPSSPEQLIDYRSHSINKTPGQSIGTDFIRKFRKNKAQEFSIKAFAMFGKSEASANSVQTISNIRFIKNENQAKDHQFTIQSDYVHPLKKKQRLEVGLKAIFRRASSNYESYSKFNPQDDYQINITNSDRFAYHQEVYGIYASHSFPVKKYNFRTGIRVEHTEVNGNFITTGTKVSQSYNNVSPNFLVATSLKGGHSFTLSYSLRLSRPYISNLNPFINNTDSLVAYTGNPELDPQIFHNTSLRYSFSKGNNIGVLTLGNSFSNSNILYTYLFNDATGVTTFKPLNGGKSTNVYLFAGIYLTPKTNFKLNIDGNVYYYRIESPETSQSNKGFSGSIGFNSSYTLNTHFAITGSTTYYFPVIMLQGSIAGYPNHGIGARYSFAKNKWTVTGRINNPFTKHGQVARKSTWSDVGFIRERTQISPFRSISLAINWNFGKLNEQVSKKRGVQNNDLL